MRFDQYCVGDYVILERRFTQAHFLAFESFSGDSNPLHKDAKYGAASEFKQTVVPMQMVASPLSAIAGMHFPGEPSLFLGQDIHAVAPVFFGERLTYSARIRAINPAYRVLTLSVLVLRGIEVVLEGELRIQSRLDEWLIEPHYISAGPPTALITGASGAIGAAIARALARQGWHLWLHARAETAAAAALVVECAKLGGFARLVTANLERAAERARLSKSLSAANGPTVLVHTASPPLDASLSRLAAVNYTAFRELSEAILPSALKRQDGAILTIGSTALDHSPAGWDNYIAAKAMAASYINNVNKRFGNHGIRGMVLAPGLVRTPYSAKWIKSGNDAMLPEEVAEETTRLLTGRESTVTYVRLESGRSEAGSWGFSLQNATPAATAGATPTVSPATQKAPTLAREGFTDTVRNLLHLPSNIPMQGAGLGRTTGWDSLRHIELILGIEHTYGISFTSDEIENMRNFDELIALWEKKIAP